MHARLQHDLAFALRAQGILHGLKDLLRREAQTVDIRPGDKAQPYPAHTSLRRWLFWAPPSRGPWLHDMRWLRVTPRVGSEGRFFGGAAPASRRILSFSHLSAVSKKLTADSYK